ncbi:hypothetical protein V8G54_024212 [Vigna mungo]|uniref:GIY-YIG domain-containing protein n=1 Tax=Vigna mungo TaxID=3915 RepID=A0AAQ3RT95_VIGMU
MMRTLSTQFRSIKRPNPNPKLCKSSSPTKSELKFNAKPKSESESWCVYLILSTNHPIKTYVGITNNFPRRTMGNLTVVQRHPVLEGLGFVHASFAVLQTEAKFLSVLGKFANYLSSPTFPINRVPSQLLKANSPQQLCIKRSQIRLLTDKGLVVFPLHPPNSFRGLNSVLRLFLLYLWVILYLLVTTSKLLILNGLQKQDLLCVQRYSSIFESKWKAISRRAPRKNQTEHLSEQSEDPSLPLLRHRQAALKKVKGSLDCTHLEFIWHLDPL